MGREHGTFSCYSYGPVGKDRAKGCRCDECRAANAERSRRATANRRGVTTLTELDDGAFTCPACKGEGREWTTSHQGRPLEPVAHDCRICDGTGRLDKRHVAIEVAQLHGITAAAELVRASTHTVRGWVNATVGPLRGRGRPSAEELERQRPRLDCPCLLCMLYRAHIEVVERRIDKEARAREPEPSMAWRLEAACQGMDPAIFFPRRGADTREAKAVCASCSVRAECRDAGMQEHFGIWGGLSERERRFERRGAA